MEFIENEPEIAKVLKNIVERMKIIKNEKQFR
jgi:hypothetical protein